MKPLRLSLTNYLGFRGTHSLDLAPIRCAAVVGPNGSGKSSLFEAKRFALFGYCRVPRDLNWAVNEHEQVGKVEYEYSVGDQRFRVGRERSKAGRGKTTLWYHLLPEDGPPVVLDGKTIGETQQKIIDSLHMTDELFRITACGSQRDELELTDVDRSKRREVLGSIIIPDPLLWDRRAETAGKVARDLRATRGMKATALEGAEAKAATESEIKGLLGGLATTISGYQGFLADQEQTLTSRASERERLISEQATDKAARASLVETTQRQNEATVAVQGARTRLEGVTAAAGGRKAAAEALMVAENAGTEAAELEAKRQEREKLLGEGKTLQAQIATARSEHTAAVDKLSAQIKAATAEQAGLKQALEANIGALKREQEQGLKAKQQQVEHLTRQAEVLDSVPCAAAGNTPLVDSCPLIAQARMAREALPALVVAIGKLKRQTPWAEDEARLTEIQAETPWADDEKSLLLLQAQTPAADLVAKRDGLKEQYEAVSYSADAHAKAKALTAKVADRRVALDRIDEAAKQIPEARAALEKAQSELSALETRIATLTAQLGPERDWTAELATVDKQIADAKAELVSIRGRIADAQTRQGALTEQLRQAKEAAEQVEALRAEIAEIDQRVNLLDILGDAYAKSGIPALLVEQAVPELEAAANEVLALLSDGQFGVEFRTQRENKDGSIAEALDIVVYGPNGPRPYESFSGGQAVRVAIAVRCAVSELVAGRSGARCEMLILDEPKWLDDHGQDVLVDCLARLSERFKTILLATHSERLKDAFPQRIEVSRNGEGSRVEVAYQ
jgi:exonuclease SbcC